MKRKVKGSERSSWCYECSVEMRFLCSFDRVMKNKTLHMVVYECQSCGIRKRISK